MLITAFPLKVALMKFIIGFANPALQKSELFFGRQLAKVSWFEIQGNHEEAGVFYQRVAVARSRPP